MASAALIAKAAAAIASDERARKGVGWILVAIFSPFILLIALLCSLGSGGAEQNVSTVELCFNGGTFPDGVSEEYRAYVADMRSSLLLLDGLIAGVNAQTEEGASLDTTRVKAIFYALFLGTDSTNTHANQDFVDCFVTYREREGTTDGDGTADGGGNTEGDGSEAETETPPAVAIPIDDLSVVYANLASMLGTPITEDQKQNAESIYSLVCYGWRGGSGWSGELEEMVMSVDGFVSPLGSGWQARVSSEFGYRNCPFHGQELHTGLDMAAPTGTPIRAALAGTVITSTYNNSYGNYTMIDHGGGLTTAYAHQSQRLVAVGDQVEAGDVIGLVGSTGTSTGAHLHLEVRVNGSLQNPRNYLP